jgi:fatty acid desaturase
MGTATLNIETTPELKVIEELKLISKSEYRSVLREHIAVEDFQPDKNELLRYSLFMSIYIVGVYSIVNLPLVLPFKMLISIVMGISLASLTFFLHDLMHGAVLKSRRATYLIGLSIGVLNLFAPLFWQRVHNFHHAKTGGIDDPDRLYIWTEKPKNAFERFIYKLRVSNSASNKIASVAGMSFGFFWYFSTMLYAMMQKPESYKADSQYQGINQLFKPKEKLFIFGELLFILSFQVFMFSVVAQGNLITYVLTSFLPILIAHFTSMLYIHTNHFLSPLTMEIDDPLINSLSLKNSKVVDAVFSNFSHHVEHHLFPAMSSSHYPKIRKLLLEIYPGRFQLMPMYDAVKQLCSTPRIYADPTTLVTYDKDEKFSCLMPH